jgi:hypothetical protein
VPEFLDGDGVRDPPPGGRAGGIGNVGEAREHRGRRDQAAGTVADLEELRGKPTIRRTFPPACPVEQVTCTSGKTIKVIQDVYPALPFPVRGSALRIPTLPDRAQGDLAGIC